MSEGELKKRLLPIGKRFDDVVESEWSASQGAEDEIKEILDEANKEFHDWMKRKPTSSNNDLSFESGFRFAAALDAWMGEVAELIKKWFGKK